MGFNSFNVLTCWRSSSGNFGVSVTTRSVIPFWSFKCCTDISPPQMRLNSVKLLRFHIYSQLYTSTPALLLNVRGPLIFHKSSSSLNEAFGVISYQSAALVADLRTWLTLQLLNMFDLPLWKVWWIMKPGIVDSMSVNVIILLLSRLTLSFHPFIRPQGTPTFQSPGASCAPHGAATRTSEAPTPSPELDPVARTVKSWPCHCLMPTAPRLR